MSFLKRIFGRQDSPHEITGKRLIDFYYATLAFAEKEEKEDQKHEIARLVFLLGAIDCASQGYKMSEEDFAVLLKLVLEVLRVLPPFISILGEAFIKLDSTPVIRGHVTVGGRCFAQWLKGNTMVAFAAANFIRSAVEDPTFPKSPGQLSTMLRIDQNEG